jgi:hypothetical protein
LYARTPPIIEPVLREKLMLWRRPEAVARPTPQPAVVLPEAVSRRLGARIVGIELM